MPIHCKQFYLNFVINFAQTHWSCIYTITFKFSGGFDFVTIFSLKLHNFANLGSCSAYGVLEQGEN